MKKFNYLFLLLCIFTISACGGGSANGTDESEQLSTNTCSNVKDFQVTQNGEFLKFNITSDLSGPYEIAFAPTASFSAGNTNSLIVNEKTFEKSINDLNGTSLESNKSYTFAVRRYCSSSSKSDWGFERNLTISGNFCKSPYDLKVQDYIYNKIEWNINTYSTGTAPVKYQLQYGLQGFSLGSGTSVETTSTNYNAPFVSGTTYDIYVRSFCSGSLAYGSWIGPVTFTASNTTACVTPAFANFTIAYSTTSLFSPNVTWDNDGVSQYEYSLSTSSAIPAAGTTSSAQALGGVTFTNLSKYTNYYFYVRKKCTGNTTSNYFGPFLVKFN